METILSYPGTGTTKDSCTQQHQPLVNHHQSDITPSSAVIQQIFRQAARCGVLAPGDDPKVLYQTIDFLFKDLRPKGAMEMLLTAQIISTYLVITNQLYLSTKENLLEAANVRVNMVVKLQKVLTQQLGLLASLRGICAQKIRIERVNVTDGGQALFGSVERGR